MAYVYQHTRKSDGTIFYVGIGKCEITFKRANTSCRRNKLWHSIVNNHGYNVEILHSGIDIEECKAIEISMIKSLGRIDKSTGILCNMTDGGDGYTNPSKEALIIRSKQHKGKTIPLSQRIAISNGMKRFRQTEIGKAKAITKGRSIKVIHLESGKEFNSIKDMCEGMKLSRFNCYKSIKIVNNIFRKI